MVCHSLQCHHCLFPLPFLFLFLYLSLPLSPFLPLYTSPSPTSFIFSPSPYFSLSTSLFHRPFAFISPLFLSLSLPIPLFPSLSFSFVFLRSNIVWEENGWAITKQVYLNTSLKFIFVPTIFQQQPTSYSFFNKMAIRSLFLNWLSCLLRRHISFSQS